MAIPVIGIGVPHGPDTPRAASEANGDTRTAKLFAQVKERLDAARPDLILELTSDHFVNFFQDKLPAISVPVVDEADGPHETWRTMPWYTIKSDREFSAGLLDYGLDQDFDLSSCGELRLDHSCLVPLHFLTPEMNVPVIPIYLQGFVHPLPRARRCYEFGRMLRRFVDSQPGARRVAVIASGSISLEIGGPRVNWLDKEWMDTVTAHINDGKLSALAEITTGERLAHAGNVAGEFLNWMALFGFLGEAPPDYMQPEGGNAYAAWQVR